MFFINELTEIEEPSNSWLTAQAGLCAGACLSLGFPAEWQVLSSHVAAQFTTPAIPFVRPAPGLGGWSPEEPAGVAGASVAGRGQPGKKVLPSGQRV